MKTRWCAGSERAWTPGKVAALYLAVGVAWVGLGDRLLAALVHDAAVLERAQLWKGWLYVALMAALAAWPLGWLGSCAAPSASAVPARTN